MSVHLSHSRSAYEVSQCRALVAAIDKRAQQIGAYEAEISWTNADGAQVYGGHLDRNAITQSFLAELPQHAFFFTGWAPEVSLTRLGRLLWRATRRVAPALGTFTLLKGARYFLRQPRFGGIPLEVARRLARCYAELLPRELRPDDSFDGSDLDRLALCERLLAMARLGIFNYLAARSAALILEIGAGYGMLAATLRRAFPRCTYIIVDLPHSLALSGCYLASRQGATVSLIRERASALTDVGLVLNSDLLAIEGRPIDLAINTLSFGEMSASVVEGYATFLRRNLVVDGVLFEQNFDNAHTGRPNFCNPSAVLSRHLRLGTRANGFYLKGVPRLWVTS